MVPLRLSFFFYFLPEWWRLLRAGLVSITELRIGFETDRYQFWLILLTWLPIGIVSYFFYDPVESLFGVPLLIAIFMASGGFLLYWADGRSSSLRGVEDLRGSDGAWLVAVHILGLVPGVSRLGALVTMGRFLGINRHACVKLACLMMFPVLLQTTLLEGYLAWQGHVALSLPTNIYLGCFAAAVVSGFVALHLFLQFARSMELAIFGWYRILLGAVIVIWSVVFGV